jgi:hypothetical protein
LGRIKTSLKSNLTSFSILGIFITNSNWQPWFTYFHFFIFSIEMANNLNVSTETYETIALAASIGLSNLQNEPNRLSMEV